MNYPLQNTKMALHHRMPSFVERLRKEQARQAVVSNISKTDKPIIQKQDKKILDKLRENKILPT